MRCSTWSCCRHHNSVQLNCLVVFQADAEQSLASLKEQLASMSKVHEQLEEALKGLQGKLDLREQEMEVLNMELLAKTKLAELQREYREKMALHMPLPQVFPPCLPAQAVNICKNLVLVGTKRIATPEEAIREILQLAELQREVWEKLALHVPLPQVRALTWSCTSS